MDLLRLFLVVLLTPLLLMGCGAARRPDQMPLQRMSVREMFPGNPQAQALANAAEKGDIATMDKLVAAGADPNATGTYGVTVPVWLLYHPNKAGFRCLLELGADPNKITRSEAGQENSLMHRAAARSGYIGAEYLQMAIDIGHGDPHLEIGEFKRTPIWEALPPNNIDAFAVLLRAGVDINFTTSHMSKFYLVLQTARFSNYKATLYLLQNGADYKKKTPSGYDLIRQMQYQIHDDARYVTSDNSPQYMWFWRCVDFLEKRGETFTFTPKSVRPLVLSIEPPDIFAGLKK